VGVNVDHGQRDSDVAQRQYGGLRIGIAVTYGL
jgi:hypothetical protein